MVSSRPLERWGGGYLSHPVSWTKACWNIRGTHPVIGEKQPVRWWRAFWGVPYNTYDKTGIVHSCACMHITGDCMYPCPAGALTPHWLSRHPWKSSPSSLLLPCGGLVSRAGQLGGSLSTVLFSAHVEGNQQGKACGACWKGRLTKHVWNPSQNQGQGQWGRL